MTAASEITLSLFYCVVMLLYTAVKSIMYMQQNNNVQFYIHQCV